MLLLYRKMSIGEELFKCVWLLFIPLWCKNHSTFPTLDFITKKIHHNV